MLTAQVVVVAFVVGLFVLFGIIIYFKDKIESNALREGYERGIESMAELDYNMEHFRYIPPEADELSEDQLHILSSDGISSIGIWRD